MLPDKKTFRKVISSVVFPISLGSSSFKLKLENIPGRTEWKAVWLHENSDDLFPLTDMLLSQNQALKRKALPRSEPCWPGTIMNRVAGQLSVTVRPKTEQQYPSETTGTGSTLPAHLAPPHQLLSGVQSQTRFRTNQTKACTLPAPVLYHTLYKKQGTGNSILNGLWCQRPTELALYHISQSKDRNQRKGVLRFQRSRDWTDSAWGQLRTKPSSNAQAPDTPHIWRFAKRTLWNHICLFSCNFCNSKAGLTRRKQFLLFRQMNRRRQVQLTVIITPSDTNKVLWTNITLLWAHTVYMIWCMTSAGIAICCAT